MIERGLRYFYMNDIGAFVSFFNLRGGLIVRSDKKNHQKMRHFSEGKLKQGF